MPIFEYECHECGHVFEVFTKRAGIEEALVCRKCGSTKVDRVLSAFMGRVSDGSGCRSTTSGTG
jgi:putative FmdB family regulatory protein